MQVRALAEVPFSGAEIADVYRDAVQMQSQGGAGRGREGQEGEEVREQEQEQEEEEEEERMGEERETAGRRRREGGERAGEKKGQALPFPYHSLQFSFSWPDHWCILLYTCADAWPYHVLMHGLIGCMACLPCFVAL